MTAAETEAEQVERRRTADEDLLAAHDVDVPNTADEFWNLREELLDQYADILRLRNRLASTAPEDKAWTRDALDVRNRFTIDCAKWDVSTEELICTHSNACDNSGGEQEN